MNSSKKLLKPYNATMVLLDHLGEPQMYLEGGEIVISRKETEELVKKSKTAKTEDDFIELGKMMLEVRLKQIKREQKQ